jgi:hypothetical protein
MRELVIRRGTNVLEAEAWTWRQSRQRSIGA